MSIITKLFGTYSDREIKKIKPTVEKVLALKPQMEALSNEALQAKTAEFKARYQKGETLDNLLPEAFAVCREASRRVLQMEHFPVQIYGGIVLHQGRIAEMKTGEGKTLVATLPAYLNALTGEGVHVVTVNEYLADFQSQWMGRLYHFLGLSVGLIYSGQSPEDKKKAYAADITYGTNNELGFDYLRDNMAVYQEALSQRGHAFAIVDEVDSILIDEARTPLIISGPGKASSDLYKKADSLVRRMKCVYVVEKDRKSLEEDETADYIVDEKARSATLTAKGIKKAEEYFGIENLSDAENMTIAHHVNQAIKAHGTMKRDVNYVVKDNEVLIVDEFTGRIMHGRRYSEGLHQAIEAKENVNVARENMTLATITLQNYFRLYKKLSGMTGTAVTEEREFREIYALDVVVIPTNKPMVRKDQPDKIYTNDEIRNRAIVKQIRACYEKGQPVLVGTSAIDKSEHLSAILKREKIPHQVLNAKHHEKEAQIIAQAGRRGAVTIATNMAGRGTDILLGGNAEFLTRNDMFRKGYPEEEIHAAIRSFSMGDKPEPVKEGELPTALQYYAQQYAVHKAEVDAEHQEVVALGGLYILGTQRHDSRRVDNQLRGRAGRQGDPGESCFFLSLDDNLFRIFGADRIGAFVGKTMSDEPLEASILTHTLENAQKEVESRHFSSRKVVLEYDDVMNEQRNIIYTQRREALLGEDMRASILKMVDTVIQAEIDRYCVDKYPEYWDMEALHKSLHGLFDLPEGTVKYDDLYDLLKEHIFEDYQKAAVARYEKQEAQFTPTVMRDIERSVILRMVDTHWMSHIDEMDQMRSGIGLMAYGQKDPVNEYKMISYDMFNEMTLSIQIGTLKMLFNAKLNVGQQERTQVAKPTVASQGDGELKHKPVKKAEKIGRNEPCPCGSGKKYKNCCGQ